MQTGTFFGGNFGFGRRVSAKILVSAHLYRLWSSLIALNIHGKGVTTE